MEKYWCQDSCNKYVCGNKSRRDIAKLFKVTFHGSDDGINVYICPYCKKRIICMRSEKVEKCIRCGRGFSHGIEEKQVELYYRPRVKNAKKIERKKIERKKIDSWYLEEKKREAKVLKRKRGKL